MPESNQNEAGDCEDIAQFVRGCSPALKDTHDLPEAIREFVLHPLFLPLLMWFSNDIDARHFKDEQQRKGAAGGKAASAKKETLRIAARKAYNDNHRKQPKAKTVAAMMSASGLVYNTCLKIYEEQETKSANSK